MPIYEYVCQDCGERYEKLVRSGTDKVELICPRCGSRQARKALSLFGLRGDVASSRGAGVSTSSCGPVG
ncbi:MAG: FmdB family transcriptional regulator [Ardenticatenia bacterium]|nr:MAG: FmdB family transcriptional regulator [Ardenticatenia bacterium]